MEPDLLPTVCNLLLLFFVPSLAVYANLILGPRIFLSYHVSRQPRLSRLLSCT